jgi:hypothetical protein
MTAARTADFEHDHVLGRHDAPIPTDLQDLFPEFRASLRAARNAGGYHTAMNGILDAIDLMQRSLYAGVALFQTYLLARIKSRTAEMEVRRCSAAARRRRAHVVRRTLRVRAGGTH